MYVVVDYLSLDDDEEPTCAGIFLAFVLYLLQWQMIDYYSQSYESPRFFSISYFYHRKAKCILLGPLKMYSAGG
jgi:hypothetical protein